MKQIIQIQDKVYRSDSDKIFGNMREQVIKNIDHFVSEEHKKSAKNMQLGWVAEVSELSMTCDLKDSATNLKLSQNLMLQDSQNNKYSDVITNNCEDTQEFAMMSLPDRDFN